MNVNTRKLHDLGQSLWIDNITRTMLDDGTLARYIAELSITGLTSNPTIFEKAIGAGTAYDARIAELARAGSSGEDLFFALAVDDLARAADLFRPIHLATAGVDGWVSLEVSPLLVDDTRKTIEVAASLHAQAARPNLFIKIPGTPAGVDAIEASIFAGVPINVTLLFSREQYLAVAEAYLRGIERRIAAGLDPKVESVASIFVSRWDTAVKDQVRPPSQNKLGIAVAHRVYRAYRELLAATSVGSEQVAQMTRAAFGVVGGEGAPGGAIGRCHAHAARACASRAVLSLRPASRSLHDFAKDSPPSFCSRVASAAMSTP